jgi:adenylate cyclase
LLWLASLAGAAIVASLGWVLVAAALTSDDPSVRQRPQFGWLAGAVAEPLARLSYDLPFLLRGHADVSGACLVYVDEASARTLGQRGEFWDRRLHAQLLRRLKAAGARAVVFDIVFSDPWPEVGVDEEFADAIARHGRVVLGAALEVSEDSDVAGERVLAPTPVLRRAAAGWGLLVFRPVDADYGVRRLFEDANGIPAATTVAARLLGAEPAAAAIHWLNYYGRSGVIPSISYDRAIADDGPAEFFRDRVVMVGGRPTLGGFRLGKDDFRNPYNLIGAPFSTGAEVHLTALMNLLNHAWLTRPAPSLELAIVLAAGLILGGGLPWLRPHFAAFGAFVVAVLFGIAAVWLLIKGHGWFAWGVTSFVQAPVALGWAIGTRYFLEERRRHALREAFARYLSPQMADRIADADFDLALGGEVVEATVMFTDLENFTPLTEELDNPTLIAEVLTTYFTATTAHLLENDATIVKYLGDSVEAVWGAPLPDADHARKAVLAAWRLYSDGDLEVQGHPLHTRIGINTGRMLSGNLGSAQRFDYAVTGDAVNFASRLEGMNKHLGTSVLIADSVEEQVRGKFVLRCVGTFRVAGKKVARAVFELLGPVGEVTPPAWEESFARGLGSFCRGELDDAEREMRETIRQRGADGPAVFYLGQIAELRARGVPADWTGIVEFGTK